MVDAHDQKVTHSYVIAYPEHEPREGDPHYKDFHAYRERTKDTAKCEVGQHRNDYSECQGPLQLHHAHVEFALMNKINLAWLEGDYPGISDPSQVGAWVESAANLVWLCEWHHIGHGGVHCATSSDFEGERYIKNLILRVKMWLKMGRT